MTASEKRALEQRELGQRLRRRRLEAGLTAQAAARGVGVSHSVWCQWELGSRAYPARRLPAIAAALGIPIASLVVDQFVLQEIRVSAETLERVRREGKPAAEEFAERFKPLFFALLMAEATRPPVDLSPGARAKPRRSREELLEARANGIAAAERIAAERAAARRQARKIA